MAGFQVTTNGRFWVTAEDCLTFNVSSNLSGLVQYLLSSNEVPEPFALECERQAHYFYGPALGNSAYRQNFSQDLLQLKSNLKPAQGHRNPPTSENLATAYSIVSPFLDSPNADNRCNAISALLCIVAHRPDPQLLDSAISYLRREQVSGILEEVVKTYCWLKLPIDSHRIALGAAMLRASKIPVFDWDSELVKSLPEAIRVRVAAPQSGVNLFELGTLEFAELVQRRITAMAERIDGSPLDLEGLLQHLRDEIIDFHLSGPSIREDIPTPELTLFRYESVLENLIEWSERINGKPLKSLGPTVLDFIFVPLALMFSQTDLSQKAEMLFERTCKMLQGSDQTDLLPVYREMADMVKQGANVGEAEKHAWARTYEILAARRIVEFPTL